MHIEPLNALHIDTYVDHLARHLPEPGIDGIIAGVFQANETIDKNKFRSKILSRWNITPGQGHWEHAWGLFDGANIVGHIELIGHDLTALKHRAKLGMGLEKAYRSRGHGRQLIRSALAWAGEQNFLSWVDLNVFAHNKVALQLYRSCGFFEIGKTPDALRVNGVSIDDWHMVLSLKNPS